MLDIGEDTGALVIYTSEILAGEEIEIRPHGGAWTGTHTAVRARHMGDRVLYAGVFGSLPAGPYDLRVRPTAHGHHHHHGDDSHRHEHAHDEEAPGSEPSGHRTEVKAGAVVETTLVETTSAATQHTD